MVNVTIYGIHGSYGYHHLTLIVATLIQLSHPRRCGWTSAGSHQLVAVGELVLLSCFETGITRIPGDSRSSAVKSSGKFGIWPMAIWNGDDEITKHLRLVDWLIGWFVGWWLDWMKRVYFLPKKLFEVWNMRFDFCCDLSVGNPPEPENLWI